jgi:hypothetical protein
LKKYWAAIDLKLIFTTRCARDTVFTARQSRNQISP